LLWLLAQPVLERARANRGAEIVVLLDRSRSMDLPVTPDGGRATRTRADEAERVASDLSRAWRGRATVRTIPFAGKLGTDSTWSATRGSTALGSVMTTLGAEGREPDAVVVVSDGIVNAGDDPVAAARALGVPVHGIVVGSTGAKDRAIVEVLSSTSA